MSDEKIAITNWGATLGSMLLTKFIYEEDGKDTTQINSEIERIEKLIKRMIKIYRKDNEQESKTPTIMEEG